MSTELLERDAELAEIDRLVGDAVLGSGGVLVMEGPAGCGKTRLLRETRSRAERTGATVLAARGGEFERAFPFGVARQLFERPLASASAPERRALHAGAAALAAPALGLEAAPDRPQEEDRLFPALHGLYWLTVNLAERAPLVLVIDDLHWSDAMTLRWLRYLVERIDGLPVLVATGLRAGEPDPDTRLLESITGHERAHPLRPRSLTVDAVAALVTRRLGPGDATFAGACHRASAGNPFMLSELLAALAVEGVAPHAANAGRVHQLGPATVARSVFFRLARLPHGADALVRAVAVLGLDAELRHAAGLAGLDERTAARAADALAAAAVLAPGRPLEFVHPIVRTAVYDELPAEERALAHRDAARLLTGEGADLQRVAAHLRSCGPAGDAETVELLRRAAQAALTRGAAADAIADLRRALEEPPGLDVRGELLLELGTAERHANDAGAAVEHLEMAAAAVPDPRLRSQALRELSRALTNTGRMGEAVDAVDRAVRTLDGRDADLAREIEAELIATGQMGMLPDYSVAERLARLETASIDPGTPGGRMLHGVLAFEAIRKAHPAGKAAELAELALRAGAAAEPVVDSASRYLALLALLYAERFDQVQGRCEDELAGVHARGSASGFSVVSMVVADVAYRRGRLADAESHALSVLEIEGVESTLAREFALSTLTGCLLERGAHDEAAAGLTAAGVDALPPELLLHALLLVRGQVKIARGSTRAGLEDLEACGRLLAVAGFESSAPVPWRPAAALAHAALGSSAEAERLVGEELERARSFGAPRALGIALRAAGLVRGGPAGLELLEEAVAVLATSEAELERARALTDFGAALRRAGRDVDARDPLRSGVERAQACEATALAARARDELVAAGARPRRVALSGVPSLTPSERRVAQLAARGLANREIAQALFVTVKTVESHLGHVYAKLGIDSRAALPDELGEPESAR